MLPWGLQGTVEPCLTSISGAHAASVDKGREGYRVTGARSSTSDWVTKRNRVANLVELVKANSLSPVAD